MSTIAGKVVAITGATGNLGPAVARAFADAGARLALSARSGPDLARLEASLGLAPDRILISAGDLGDPSGALAVAKMVAERFGRVDVLLHLVGGFVPGAPVPEMSPSDVRAMLDVNLMTTFHAAHAFLPHLMANGWGRFVAVSSAYAQQPAARTSAYAASKAALEALVLSIAHEVKGRGVTANVVVVRTIDTPGARQAAPKANTAGWTTPEEVAAAMLYLCSDEGGAVNGSRIPLYGRG